MPTAFISLNSAVMQIIEHIDQGNIWGNMIEVLTFLLGKNQSDPKREASQVSSGILLSQPSPGFLIPPEDEKSVSAFINILFDKEVESRSFGKWLSAAL